MALGASLAGELRHEAAGTRKLLSRIPEDKLDWKPHDKSMTLGRLACHVAELPQWVKLIVEQGAQLTVYLRLLDVLVPGLYGPSADEQ